MQLRKLRSKVGLVFQYPEHQLFETDIFKDVCFGPKNLGLDRAETELRAFEALRLVGLDESLYYQSPFDLSGGQKRRVAIAGVLAMKPEVLILDEPTAGLDPKERIAIRNYIAELSRNKIILFARFNARVYPSATPLRYFRRSPYDLTQEAIEQTWQSMQGKPEYADIEELTNNQNERFLFSTQHLTRRYAKAISDVDEWTD